MHSELPPGTVGLLATVGEDGPHAIPVSVLRRAVPDRLRKDPRAAMALLAPGVAVTARGVARVPADPLPGAPFAVALTLDLAAVDDTLGPRTLLDAGIARCWRDEESSARHRAVLAALAALPA